ncbi:MAG: hypothetical protein IJR15_05175 [Clostridiales bacterium]|nr:hypothetical protein [Clostridiales bacterium]
MKMEVCPFDKLDSSDLFVDCVYKGGPTSDMSSEPFHKLIPKCENAGGFRKKLREQELEINELKKQIEIILSDRQNQ